MANILQQPSECFLSFSTFFLSIYYSQPVSVCLIGDLFLNITYMIAKICICFACDCVVWCCVVVLFWLCVYHRTLFPLNSDCYIKGLCRAEWWIFIAVRQTCLCSAPSGNLCYFSIDLLKMGMPKLSANFRIDWIGCSILELAIREVRMVLIVGTLRYSSTFHGNGCLLSHTNVEVLFHFSKTRTWASFWHKCCTETWEICPVTLWSMPNASASRWMSFKKSTIWC